jgi:hypothetical protein
MSLILGDDPGNVEVDEPDVVIPVPSGWVRTRDDAVTALVQLLNASHTGRDKGISAAALARQMCVTERGLRTLVAEARQRGTPISATPETGYFVAQSATDLQESCAFLRSRAMHHLLTESHLRRIPLADVLGELRSTS